jgi:NAD(P)H-flavin reductase
VEQHAATVVDPTLPRPFRIARVIRETRDTFTWDLQPEAGGAPLTFVPGQFNMLFRFAVGEVPVSISGDADRPDPLRHTIRAVGTVTRRMAEMRAGGVVGVRGPFGSSWPVAAAKGSDVVVVAGGVGLAPLRPAILHVLARRGCYGRFVVLYGARTPRDILFRRDLERWSARLDTCVDATVDRAAGDWRGNVGVVTRLIARAGFDPEVAMALVCGPEIMMRFAIEALRERGVAADRIYLSMERNMKCALATCGHCQWSDVLVCRDGPVFRLDRVARLFGVREL